MKLVILESPFAAGNGYTVEQNIEYARAAVRDSLSRVKLRLRLLIIFPMIFSFLLMKAMLCCRR